MSSNAFPALERAYTEELAAREQRLAEIDRIELGRGAHENLEAGACLMELVSWIAGEPWSDDPRCVSPVIAEFLRAWNDSLGTDQRNALLKPLIPQLIGTAASDDVETRRGWMVLDWLVRTFTPAWLDLVPALHHHAKALRNCAPIDGTASAVAAESKIRAADIAAGIVTTHPASSVTGSWGAARAGGGTAAWAAAKGRVPTVTAWNTARAAVAATAGFATTDTLRSTTERLQASALDLVRRMIVDGGPA